MRISGKQFVYRVENGQNPVNNFSAPRNFRLSRTPRNYEWTPGQTVVYVQPTAAGWMPTSLVGTLIGFVYDSSKRKAVVIWHDDTHIAPTISFQRIRPISLNDGPFYSS